MPKYKFKAVDINNKKIKGTFIADDDDDFKQIVTNQNYYLISYHKIPESSQMFGFLERIRTADFTMFCRQFAIMLTAGMPIDQAVSFLVRTTKNKKLKDILEVVHSDLLKGTMLSDSFEKYPKTFPPFFRNMVKIGEESGNLDAIFARLADYYEDEQRIKKKVKEALSYPIFLLILILAALMVISIVVMPKFSTLFDQFNGELPLITRIVIAVSDFIKTYALHIIAIAIVTPFLIAFLMRNKKFHYGVDKAKISIPLIKRINIAVVTSRFASSFAILLASGIPLINAMTIASKLLNNMVVEEKLTIAKNQIKTGEWVSKSLNTINLFPPMLIEMIAVGEQTSSLEEVLNKTTTYFDEQVDTEIKAMTAAINPVIIMIIGLMIAAILLSIFLPMLGLLGAIENQTSSY